MRRMRVWGSVAVLGIAFFTSGFDRNAPPVVRRYVSLARSEVNMREGPSFDHKVKWVYHRQGLPVKVVRLYQGWRRVRDQDGAEGWVVARLLNPQRSAVVVGKGVAPMRAGADASAPPIIPLVLDVPRVGGKPGRPKERPDEWSADRGSDSDSTRRILRWLGIEPKIAKRKTAHGSGLGKVRWVVERTISWIKGLRRMRVRYDRLGVVRDAFTTLAACVVCFDILNHDTT